MDVQPINSSTENKESFGLRQTWVRSQLHCWLASSFPWSPYPTCHQALSVLLLKYIFNLVTSLPFTVTVSIQTTIAPLNRENSLMTSLLVSVPAPYLPFPTPKQSYLSLEGKPGHFTLLLKLFSVFPLCLEWSPRSYVIWPVSQHHLISLSPSLTIFQPHWPLICF